MLRDAQRYGTLFNPARLKLARESLGLSQTDLAAKLKSATAPAISQFENAVIKPSASTLTEIAGVLGFPVAFFAASEPPNERQAFFRRLRSAPAKQRASARARAEIVSLLVRSVEQYVELPSDNVPKHSLPPTANRQAVEAVAAKVRKEWKVPSGPVVNVLAELERRGIVVARFPLKVEGIDAFSVAFDSRPVVVLSADKGAADRSRFDAAHELGHLVIHQEPNEDEHKIIEKQAHWFAAGFLAPADEIEDELPRFVDWQQLAMLKGRWGLSMASLLVRSKDLRRISEAEFERAMKFMSMKGWRKSEPVQLGTPERPTLLEKATDALSLAGMSLRAVAEEANLPYQIVEQIIGASTDKRPRVEI